MAATEAGSLASVAPSAQFAASRRACPASSRRARRLRRGLDRAPPPGRPRPAAVPPRLRAALPRPCRLSERDPLADAGNAGRPGCSSSRPVRQRGRRRRPLRALGRRLVLRRPPLRPGRCADDGRRAPRVPGLRPALPRARERRPLRGRLRARRAPPVRVEAPDGGGGRARARRRAARLRPSGRPGAPAPRACAAPRGAWRRPRLGRPRPSPSRALVPLVALAAHNAVRADDFTVVRGGSASLSSDVRRGPHRRARKRRGLRGARASRLAGAAPERAVPVARDRPRDVLLVGQLADARRPHRARRPDVGLGRRLPPPRPRRARGDPRAPGAYARGVSKDLWRLLLWPLYAPVEAGARPPPGSGRRPAAPVASRRRRRRRPTTSRSRPLARRRTSRRPTGGSARCGRRRPSTDSSSATPADRVLGGARPRGEPRCSTGLPDCVGHPSLVARLNDLSRLYPRPFMWLLVGIAAALWRRPRGIAVPALLRRRSR